MNKKLLLVDNDLVLLKSLVSLLSDCTDLFETHISSSVDDALFLTKVKNYDLVITDIHMPGKTGIDLMINLKQNMFKGTIMVMTGLGDRETFEKIRELGGMNIIVKPIHLQWFKKMVVKFFEEKQGLSGTMDAIDLASILQVINLEKKSAAIRIEVDGKYGFLYFEKGELINAEFDDLAGEKAAAKLIGLNKGKFSILKIKKGIKKEIEKPFISFLMNIMKDVDDDNLRKKWRMPQNKANKEIDVHIDKKIFKDIKSISGFKGAGIYTKNGDLITEEKLASINFTELGYLGVSLYEIATDGFEKSELGKLELLHLQSDKKIFVFSWLIYPKIFIGVIIGIEGNLGILKHHIKNISQSIDSYITFW